ncbi:restriction endonuclease subunit S [uncultured Jannaschia sp.]|uniref:restriction endonuclease subunit S n=1 Tax=uncultured Jannaschia sp. TaxID=293347 RepID=UPI0026041845|nr:restriction endonuclease subunit S [uncultured Jannaschia sp.]
MPMKLRYAATIRNSNVDKVVDANEDAVRLCNYVHVYKNYDITADMEFDLGSANAAEITTFGLKVGDVVITKDSEDRTDIGVPAMVRSTAADLVCGYHLTILRPRTGLTYGPFLFYALLSKPAREAFSLAANGVTRYGLTQSGMRQISIPFPEFEAQKVIADFLYQETARIDQLIERKQGFLFTISERLEALVAEALKCDTLNWVRFERLAERVLRPVLLSEHQELVRLGLFNRGRGIFKKPAADEEGMGDSDFFFVRNGDLILSGQFAWEGAVAMASEDEDDCVVSHRYPVYRGRLVQTEYLLALFRSKHGDFVLNDASRGSAGRNRPLNTWRLGKEKLPIPPTTLQEQIGKTIKLERELRKKNAQSVSRLREYRAALITAAVTGQIDVTIYDRHGITDRALDKIEAEADA